MLAALDYLWLPWLLCLLLTGMHAYLGLHVLRRGVIFVDLALAQTAALGVVVGLLVGLPPGSTWSHGFALVFTLLGAVLLAGVTSRTQRVPQEACIGVVYAAAAAACALLLGAVDDAHGVETVQATLTGQSIVWVTAPEVAKTALLYAAIGGVHWWARRPLAEVAADPRAAAAAGRRVRLWDFFFYATFGVVITSSVQLAGVLLVFAFLIVPAVVGALTATRDGARLLVGWVVGAVGSFVGLLFSYRLPSGPAVVLALAALLGGVAAVRAVWRAPARGPMALRLAAAALVAAALLAAIALLPWRRWAQVPPAHHHAVPEPAPPQADANLGDPEELLRVAAAELARGEHRLLPALRALAQGNAPPFFRDEARALLARHDGK